MGLEDRLDNPIGSLSGGQRQALTLLMATYRRPELLLLDEHTAALDPRSAEQVIRLTEQVVRRQHLTTLMVTHSMAHAASLGDRLIMVHQGRLIFDVVGRRQAAAPPPRPAREVRGAPPLRPARRDRGAVAPRGVRLKRNAVPGDHERIVHLRSLNRENPASNVTSS